MLKLGTVFVLGAAFSSEMELPLGGGLKTKILGLLPTAERPSPDEAFANLINNNLDSRDSLLALGKALPFALSIDNLVQHRAHDPWFVTAAKWGIARAIAQAEQASPLAHDGRGRGPKPLPKDNSYEALFQLIVAGVDINSLAAAFGRLQVVTFNYDRTLEVYLHRALQAYSGLSPEAATRILDRATIVHAYGALGANEEGLTRPTDIRPDDSPRRIEMDAAGLRTFSEKEDSASGDVIRELVGEAERLIFLGCAFHDQNLRLIKPRLSRVSSIYATAYVVPQPDAFAQPPFDRFSIKQAQPMRRALLAWPSVDRHVASADRLHFEIEAMTCRQLIAMYGGDWRE